MKRILPLVMLISALSLGVVWTRQLQGHAQTGPHGVPAIVTLQRPLSSARLTESEALAALVAAHPAWTAESPTASFGSINPLDTDFPGIRDVWEFSAGGLNDVVSNVGYNGTPTVHVMTQAYALVDDATGKVIEVDEQGT